MKLSTTGRKRLKAAMFGLPAKRMFPMHDANHQRDAISGATRSFHAGNITEEEMNRVKGRARRLLGIKASD